MYLSLIKPIFNKSVIAITLSGEKLKVSLRSRTRKSDILANSIQYGTESPSQGEK